MTDEKNLDEDRKSQLEHRLYKRYEVIYDEGEEAVSSWIDENQVKRSEAEQIADSNGNFQNNDYQSNNIYFNVVTND